MKKLGKLALLSSVLLSTGCATILSDKAYPVQIQSNPSGAEFTIVNRNGVEVASGVTPQTLVLQAGSGYFKGEKYTITYKKGKFKQTIILEATVDGWYWGNVALLSPLGALIIDPLSGAMFKLPPVVNANLSSNKGASLSIMSIDDLTAEQRSQLEPITL